MQCTADAGRFGTTKLLPTQAKGSHDSLASQDAGNIETCRLELASRVFTSTPVRPHLQFEGVFLDSLSMRRSVKQSSIRCASYIHKARLEVCV